jgi:hypothetical protein
MMSSLSAQEAAVGGRQYAAIDTADVFTGTMRDNSNSLPMWIGGVLLALVLILISVRGGVGLDNPRLVQEFTPRPTDPSAPTVQPFELPKINLPSLPPQVQDSFVKLRDRFVGGQAVPALTPEATGPRARVAVGQVRRVGEAVQVQGTITNIADGPLDIPPGAFSFRDSAGISYATAGSGGTTLSPGQSTSFDLSVPLPAERGLTLILTLPPDPPLDQVLVVETT